MRFTTTFTIFALILSAAPLASANGLRLYDISAGPNGRDVIWEVDTATPAVFNGVEQDINNAIAGIEYGQGVFYAASTNTNTDLFVLQPGTGTLLNTITMTFPVEGNVITSMEFVGGTLYGGLTTEGSQGTANSFLVTIDTTSGNTTLVGDMGFASPTGGLAYDGSTLYTVNSGATGAATLYTVDLGSGAATPVGSVIDQNQASVTLTGLEFGTDGILYGLGRSADNDNLFTINPATGGAVRLGLLANVGGTTSSLTAVPEPTSLALLGLAGLASIALVRRRK